MVYFDVMVVNTFPVTVSSAQGVQFLMLQTIYYRAEFSRNQQKVGYSLSHKSGEMSNVQNVRM